MAWIELHQSLWTHKKTFKLAELLGINETYAAAHMIRLWTWALDNAQDGNLSDLSSSIIAKGSGWFDDPEQFVNAAIKAGWIDQDGDRLYIHDWHDYAGRLIEKREANKERKRRSRARHAPVTRTSQENHEDVREMSAPVTGLPNHTIPNLTIPNNNLVDVVVENEPEFLDERSAKVYRTFEQEGFGTISPLMKDTLDHLMYDYTAEWVVRAMHAAAKQSIRKISYVEGILKQWKASGVDEPWNQERTEKVTPYPSRTNRTRSNKPHIPVVEQRTGGEKLSDDELQEAIRLAQELEGA